MNRSLIVIYTAIILDAAGIGLIFPILPNLLQDVTHVPDVSPYIGVMIALYAIMQFIFSPVLGAVSDRIGRRPVLLISLAGAAANYLLLASATNLWMLLAGRAIAGMTSANVSVATACITDITPEEDRARRFGLLNAMFGMGFIIGPVLGGALSEYGLRLPFIAAALLTGFNLLLALLALPESRVPTGAAIHLTDMNPLRPLYRVLSMKHLLPIISVFFIFSATGESYGVCWALWGEDAFHWNGLWIGLSLGAFGVCQTLAQALLPGPAVRVLGERAAILTGVASVCAALTIMAFVTTGWMVFAIMPVFALGGIGMPALQSLATRLVDETEQGQLQGVLASVVSLASIVAPLGFSSLYLMTRPQWPGAVWLSVVALYVIGALMVLTLRFKGQQAPPHRI